MVGGVLVLSSDEHGRLLLRTGIAGSGTMTSSGRVYDDQAVRGVRDRPRVDEREVAGACPRGMLVVRLPRTVDLDLSRPWPEVARQGHPAPSPQEVAQTPMGCQTVLVSRKSVIRSRPGATDQSGSAAGARRT